MPSSKDGLMDGLMEGWMHGWMDGRMDGGRETFCSDIYLYNDVMCWDMYIKVEI
jgi:hypothetical protein